MGAWVTASIFIASIIWMNVKATPQQFQVQYENPAPYQPNVVPETGGAELHSASSFPTHDELFSASMNSFIRRAAQEEQGPGGSISPYRNAERIYEINAEKQVEAARYPSGETNDRYVPEEQPIDDSTKYHDQKTSPTTQYGDPVYQVEKSQGEYYHDITPQHGLSSYDHQAHESHGEVHYHQHKHIHKHEHKQEHMHKHHNDHQHKHLHHQQHKHEHHSEHKHGHHEHHDHHQDHKHDHHHDHKHGHHQDHKHDHHHGHKHDHHSENKHEHHHGHKHGHKHGHEHKHKHHEHTHHEH